MLPRWQIAGAWRAPKDWTACLPVTGSTRASKRATDVYWDKVRVELDRRR
jgi:hypothetical protein